MNRRLPFISRWRRVIQEDGWRGFGKYMIRFPRKLVPTKAGWVFFGFMLVIILFAYSTNNNLLFLIFSAMMSFMVLSGMMSEASLGNIQVARRFPQEIFARRPFMMEFEVNNRARIMSAYAFFVRDPGLLGTRKGPMAIQLKAGGTIKLRAQGSITRRGIVSPPSFELATNYPFLLFTKSRRIRSKDEVLVYPAIHQVNLSLETLFGPHESGERDHGLDGMNFSHVREYTTGEALKKVDWKKSAKFDDFFIKEFTSPATRRVTVTFNPSGFSDIEDGLRTAASLLVWLARNDIPFALCAAQIAPMHHSSSNAHLQASLKQLALYDEHIHPLLPAKAGRVIEVSGNGNFRIR